MRYISRRIGNTYSRPFKTFAGAVEDSQRHGGYVMAVKPGERNGPVVYRYDDYHT